MILLVKYYIPSEMEWIGVYYYMMITDIFGWRELRNEIIECLFMYY